ncbi:DUF397 domain-containing protein [Actinophytocola glycyrrhizae]|uniref:DUF397 domain-containing protein n=1 Tax=Actinophytocola glycyrrhizae TaxID=2044873 RepID=A0ABV9SCL7_9PSEU
MVREQLVRNGDVLPDDAWRSAGLCGPNGGNCVEVNLGAVGVVGVRDSKSAPGPVLTFDDAGWAALLAETKSRHWAFG